MNTLEAYKQRQHQVFGEFLHEIKTPLAIIRTHLESEISNEAIPLDVRQKLVMDVEEIARSTQLLHDMKTLLDDSSRGKEEFEIQSLLALVMDVIETLEPQADEKNQKISLVCSENVEIFMHPYKLKQLFFNLIVNAIKYSPPHTKIAAHFEISEEDVCVRVIDEGMGIDKEEHEKVFDAFYRVPTDSIEGTGLGLAVSQAIAHIHGSQLTLKSELGKGCEFSICFKR